MKEPRFGEGTSIYYLTLVMIGIAVIAIGLSDISVLASFAASLLWILFCQNVVDPWFFPERKRKCTIKSPKSILVAFDSAPIYLIRKGERNIVSLELKKKNGKNWIYVYESHLMGYDRLLDGLDINFVDLVAGYFTAKLTDDGFLVEWDADNWIVLDR